MSQNKIVSNQQLVLYSSGTLGAAEDEESPQANLTQEEKEEEKEEEEEDAQAFASSCFRYTHRREMSFLGSRLQSRLYAGCS